MRRWLMVVILVVLAACGAPASSIPAPSGSVPAASGTPSSAASATPSAATSETASASGAPQASAGATPLNVFAAASLAEAFAEIGRQFDAANGSRTTFNLAGSQQLAQQIVQGAPADVFASANTREMNTVIDAGDVISGTQQTFARNRLVVIYPNANPAQLGSLQDLAKPGVKLVLAAREVPAGQYSLDFLAKASASPQFTATYSDTVLRNVVSYEQNVRAVLGKVTLGEADAGIVYTSDVGPDAARQVGQIPIPDELNVIATYPIAPVAASQQAELAQRFVEYVLSSDGQQILEQYGFIPASR